MIQDSVVPGVCPCCSWLSLRGSLLCSCRPMEARVCVLTRNREDSTPSAVWSWTQEADEITGGRSFSLPVHGCQCGAPGCGRDGGRSHPCESIAICFPRLAIPPSPGPPPPAGIVLSCVDAVTADLPLPLAGVEGGAWTVRSFWQGWLW